MGNNIAFGGFKAMFFPTNKGVVVRESEIFVNRDDFGKDGIKFISLIAHHEATEMFEVGKRIRSNKGFTDEGDCLENRECHCIALNAEFDLAFEIGLADEYIHFLIDKANQIVNKRLRKEFIKENLTAYKKAKRRFLLKSRTKK